MTAMQWVSVMIGVVLVTEILSGWHRKIYRRHDWLVMAGCIALSQLTRPVAAMLYASLFAWLLPSYRGVLADAPFWASVVILFLVVELAFYTVHRMAHQPVKHPLLYGMHRTHHAAQYLNVTVMMRVNIFWPFVMPYGWCMGLAFYLGLEAASAVVLATVMVWNALTHSALRWDDALAKTRLGNRMLSIVEYLFITPRMHHTHHGWGKDGKSYRNYAVMLTIYDRLFNTLHVPEGRPAHYGVPGKDKHWTEEVMFPLVRRKRSQEPVVAEETAAV